MFNLIIVRDTFILIYHIIIVRSNKYRGGKSIMKRKIIGIFVTTLMIITAFSAVAINVREPKSDVSAAIDDKPAINSEKLEIIINSSENNVNNNLEVSINPYTLNELTFPNDVYKIYEGLHWKLHVTVYWDPPQGEQICLWVDPNTLPEGATFPECICNIDSVTGTLDWTPAIGQAGTYEIVFYAGHSCYEPVGTFTVTVIVHPYNPKPQETHKICAEQEWHLKLTARWVPPQPEKIICLWVDSDTLPEGATFTDCHCDYGEVTSDLYWTPTPDQVGEYIITFLIGEDCGYYVFPYPIKVIVTEADHEPPVVEIYGPLNGSEITEDQVTITGYITDNAGIVSIESHHEWKGDEDWVSTTVDPPVTTYPIEWNFQLHDGWNKITISAEDIGGNYGEDNTVLYDVVALNEPTNEEKEYFKTKMSRYNTDGEKCAEDVHSVKDIIKSLGQNGAGTYIKVAEKDCTNGKVSKCVIKVKTRFVKWDPKVVKNDKHVGFCLLESKKAQIEKENNKKIKVVYVNFAIMLKPAFCKDSEKNKVGQLDNDRLFYHELLHAQLAVDKWKKTNWEGWSDCCKCNTAKLLSKIDIADKDHKVIPDLQLSYLEKLGKKRGFVVDFRNIRAGAAGAGGTFKYQIPLLPGKVPKPPVGYHPINVDGSSLNFTLTQDNKLEVEGKLIDKTKNGRLLIWLDPPTYALIAHVDLLAEGLPPLKPITPSGPTSGKVGKTYTYTTSTTDPDGDKLKYGFDWNGDGIVDDWTGFIDSGSIASKSHSWDEKGTYEIKVKAEDENGLESEWSDPLSVSMPKNKIINIPFLEFLEKLLQNGKILYQLIQQFFHL